ncbi:hypothetical protein, partial [Listeria monocytogenes]|uniref:hypothetical protein n=1 Tax=Listeria monocytogenes TaxID=1639 RepID=UPI002FDB9B21
MAFNNGVVIGCNKNEKNIQKFMGVLNNFLGEQPNFQPDQNILKFTFGQVPNGWKLFTQNGGMQQMFK